MTLRKRRVVRTTDQLHVPSQVQLPPVKPPRVFGPFNEFVRKRGMRDFGAYKVSALAHVPLFVAPSLELPDQIEQLSDNVIRVYGAKPIMLSTRFGRLPEIFEHEMEAKFWGDQTILWSAATRMERSSLDNLMQDKGPDGTAYSIQLAAVYEDVGLAIVANPLARLHNINVHACLAAREPGYQGGLRFRGVSPVLLRLHYLANEFMAHNPVEPLDLEPILEDKRNDDDAFDDL
jgi:hypothetical protein